jgi:hypothetical protein
VLAKLSNWPRLFQSAPVGPLWPGAFCSDEHRARLASRGRSLFVNIRCCFNWLGRSWPWDGSSIIRVGQKWWSQIDCRPWQLDNDNLQSAYPSKLLSRN